jgi:hypothetical protein
MPQKKACPGYAVMRSLVLSFRTILRTGKIKTLHAWMKKADEYGLYRMQRFVRRLKQDQSGWAGATNRVLLHPECHDRVHRQRLSVSKPRLL